MNSDDFKQRVLYFGSRIERWLLNARVAPDDVPDLVQVVVARAVQYQASYDPSRELGAWLCRIAKNVARDHLEKANKAAPASDEIESAPASSNPEQDLIRQENRHLVSQMWEGLPEEMQALLNARFVDDLSFDEIADLLHLPRSTVHDRLDRTLAICRKMLRKKGITDAVLPLVLPHMDSAQTTEPRTEGSAPPPPSSSRARTAWGRSTPPPRSPSLLEWLWRRWKEATLVLGGAGAGALLLYLLTVHQGAMHVAIVARLGPGVNALRAAAVVPAPVVVGPVCSCPEVAAPPPPPSDGSCPGVPVPNTRERSLIRAVAEAAERGDMETAWKLLALVHGPQREELRRKLLAMPTTR